MCKPLPQMERNIFCFLLKIQTVVLVKNWSGHNSSDREYPLSPWLSSGQFSRKTGIHLIWCPNLCRVQKEKLYFLLLLKQIEQATIYQIENTPCLLDCLLVDWVGRQAFIWFDVQMYAMYRRKTYFCYFWNIEQATIYQIENNLCLLDSLLLDSVERLVFIWSDIQTCAVNRRKTYILFSCEDSDCSASTTNWTGCNLSDRE